MGTSDRRSYQMNISISRDLKTRMDDVRVPVNWSQTAAGAFKDKLLKIESEKDPKNLDGVIARMRAKAALEEKEEYEAGLKAGRIWAREDASPKELRRLEAAGRAENAESLAQTIWPEIGRHQFSVTSEDFWVRPWERITSHGLTMPISSAASRTAPWKSGHRSNTGFNRQRYRWRAPDVEADAAR